MEKRNNKLTLDPLLNEGCNHDLKTIACKSNRPDEILTSASEKGNIATVKISEKKNVFSLHVFNRCRYIAIIVRNSSKY